MAVLGMYTKQFVFTLPFMIIISELCFLRTNKKVQWKWFIPFLIFSIVFFSIFCCCLTNTEVEAKETVSSHCHSEATERPAAADQEASCDCPKTLSIASLQTFTLGDLAVEPFNGFFVTLHPVKNFLSSGETLLSLQDPPEKYTHSQPLYIKHSILRI